MTSRTVHPLGDHIVITFRTERSPSTTSILIPDIAQDQPNEATVIAVGPGSRDKSGARVALAVKAGDRVFVGRHAGAKVVLDDEAYTIVRSGELLAIHA